MLGLSYATLVPMNATGLAVIARNLIGNVFQFGFHYTLASYDVYLGEILLAEFAILLFGYFSIRGVRFAGSFQVILTIGLITGVVIVGLAAIFSPKASLTNLVPLFNPDTPKFSGICAVLAIAPFLFVGFDTVPQSAEEFKFSNKKTKAIMIVAILFGALVYITLTLITAAVVPEEYSSWSDYISTFETLDGLESLPTFYAAYELLGYFGVFVFGIAVLGATLSCIVGFYMATTRLLYSISKEHLIPQWFAELHPKYKTPRNSIIFLMVLSLVAPFFGRTVFGWLVDMSSLGAAIGYAYTSAATFKLSKQEKKKSTMITGLVGTIMGIIFAILLLIPIPGLNCSLGKESYICLIIWVALGFAFYIRSNKHNKTADKN
jgi:amino acid transporter